MMENIPSIGIGIEETLAIRPRFRSDSGRTSLRRFLSESELAPELQQCSESDIEMMLASLELRSIDNCAEILCTQGESVTHCMIVVSGHENILVTSTALDRGNEESPPHGINAVSRRQSTENRRGFHVGSFIGGEVFRGKTVWDTTITVFAQTDHVAICTIPMEIIQQYVGRAGSEAQQFAETFWASTRLKYLTDWADPFSFATPVVVEFSLYDAPVRQKLDLLTCGRVRTFPSNAPIFSQGKNRNFLYFVVSGECALLKLFDDDCAVGIVPQEVDIGQRFLSGDFVFMDGDQVSWLEKILEQQRSDIWNNDSGEPTTAMLIAQKSKAGPFQFHKHTLWAMTQVEVLVLPLMEIAKSRELFRELLLLSSRVYPGALLTNADIIHRYHENRIWEASERTDVVRGIFADRFGNELVEEYFIHPDSCVNASYIRAKAVGGKLATNNRASSMSYLFQSPKAHKKKAFKPVTTSVTSPTNANSHSNANAKTVAAELETSKPTTPVSPEAINRSPALQSPRAKKTVMGSLVPMALSQVVNMAIGTGMSREQRASTFASHSTKVVPFGDNPALCVTPSDFVELYESRKRRRARARLLKALTMSQDADSKPANPFNLEGGLVNILKKATL